MQSHFPFYPAIDFFFRFSLFLMESSVRKLLQCFIDGHRGYGSHWPMSYAQMAFHLKMTSDDALRCKTRIFILERSRSSTGDVSAASTVS